MGNWSRDTSARFLPGRDAQLGRERLDQHRHQVAGDDDPQQEIAELGAALNVGGEVAGVDVRDRGDERRAEERQHRAPAVALPGEDAARGADRRGVEPATGGRLGGQPTVASAALNVFDGRITARALCRVGLVVAADVGRVPLDGDQLVDDRLLLLGERSRPGPRTPRPAAASSVCLASSWAQYSAR